MNNKGKELVHAELIKDVQKSPFLLIEIATIHIACHQKGNSFETAGNQFVDEIAKGTSLK